MGAFWRRDIFIILVTGILLYFGSSWQFSKKDVDAAIYQCDATAFWQGQSGLQHLPVEQCAFLNRKGRVDSVTQSMIRHHIPHPIVQVAQSQMETIQFHTLPREYPILSLIPFSLPLIAPAQFYQQAYALWAILVVILLYFVIKRYTSWENALLFMASMVIAGWSTAASRFDLFPAALTLGALILANRGRWAWAYVFIMMGILLKFYPVLLLPPLLIAEQKSYNYQWNAWQRWKAFAIGLVVFAGIGLISLATSIPGTVGSLQYFKSRPLEIESFPGALVWLAHYVGYPYQYQYSFVSMNVLSSISDKIGTLSTATLIIGLLVTFWLQWRGKLDVSTTCLVVMALVLGTSKIVSPQYIIWMIPLVWYVGKPNRRWIVLWGIVMMLTFFIYPIVYNFASPPPEILFPLALVRGLVLLGFVVIMLWRHAMPPKIEKRELAVKEVSVLS